MLLPLEVIECFPVTSERRPCLFSQLILRKSNSILMPGFSFVSIGNHMISSAIWKNKHKLIFQRLTKLHEPVGRVQFTSALIVIPNCSRKIM